MAFPSDVWGFVKKLDSLPELEVKHARAIANLQEQIDGLLGRMNRLEAREELVVGKAEAAAGMAAMGAATASMADAVRRAPRLR